MLRRGIPLLPRLAAARGLTAADAGSATASVACAATCPGAEAPRPQDVQQPPSRAQQHHQLRLHSAALPQPAYASDDEGQPGGRDASVPAEVQQQRLRDYHRRLEEMQLGDASSRPPSASQQQPRQQPPHHRVAAWPTPDEVAERLRSGKGASCSSAALPQPPPVEHDGAGSSSSALDWREVVERVRASQQQIDGAQMLTDTFG